MSNRWVVHVRDSRFKQELQNFFLNLTLRSWVPKQLPVPVTNSRLEQAECLLIKLVKLSSAEKLLDHRINNSSDSKKIFFPGQTVQQRQGWCRPMRALDTHLGGASACQVQEWTPNKTIKRLNKFRTSCPSSKTDGHNNLSQCKAILAQVHDLNWLWKTKVNRFSVK